MYQTTFMNFYEGDKSNKPNVLKCSKIVDLKLNINIWWN